LSASFDLPCRIIRSVAQGASAWPSIFSAFSPGEFETRRKAWGSGRFRWCSPPACRRIPAWSRGTNCVKVDFPAEHWDHLRTSNPIESVFATVRHRTVRTKGALSAKTAKLMVFKLVNAAAKTWRRLKGENQLPKVVRGVKFQNGIEVIKMPAHHAA